MPIVNYIEKMMGMQDVEVKKIEEEEKRITIYIEMYRKDCECPVCGRKTRRVHDYRWQRVKELPAFGNDVESCASTSVDMHAIAESTSMSRVSFSGSTKEEQEEQR